MKNTVKKKAVHKNEILTYYFTQPQCRKYDADHHAAGWYISTMNKWESFHRERTGMKTQQQQPPPDCRLIFSFNYLPYHPDIFEKWPHVLVTGPIFFKI